MKEIGYDVEIYLKNLRKINGGGNDKNKDISLEGKSIEERVVRNRLKFV